jgi:hypothetical protein
MEEQPGFFDGDERLKALSAAGDPLERLAQVIDFEVFRADLEAALSRSDVNGAVIFPSLGEVIFPTQRQGTDQRATGCTGRLLAIFGPRFERGSRKRAYQPMVSII